MLGWVDGHQMEGGCFVHRGSQLFEADGEAVGHDELRVDLPGHFQVEPRGPAGPPLHLPASQQRGRRCFCCFRESSVDKTPRGVKRTPNGKLPLVGVKCFEGNGAHLVPRW